jgi:hypothetical protein
MGSLALAAAAAVAAAAGPLPELSAASSPIWAHTHFVWLDSSRSNQSAIEAYVADYAAHNITVGA